MATDIEESEQNKTGCLTRIRRMRGILYDFEDLDINRKLTFQQRDMFLIGFYNKMDLLLDEAEYILKEFTEDLGEQELSIESLESDVTHLEEELYNQKEINNKLEEENQDLRKKISKVRMGENWKNFFSTGLGFQQNEVRKWQNWVMKRNIR